MEIKKIVSKSKDGNNMEIITQDDIGQLTTRHIRKDSSGNWKYFFKKEFIGGDWREIFKDLPCKVFGE